MAAPHSATSPLCKLCFSRAGYRFGPVFRGINGAGGPLSYVAAHHRWENHCTAAGADLHQLRHAHAAELVNASAPIEAVRRLGV